MLRRSARLFERNIRKVPGLSKRPLEATEPEKKKIISEADQPDILTSEMRQYPLDEQLFILTERMADKNPVVILRHLAEFSVLTKEYYDEKVRDFLNSVVKILTPWFSALHTSEENKSLDAFFYATCRLYRDFGLGLNDFIESFDGEYRSSCVLDNRCAIGFNDEFVTTFLIIENIIIYLLTRLSDKPQMLDLAFLKFSKMLCKISDDEDEDDDEVEDDNGPSLRSWATELSARICIRVLITHSVKLTGIMELLFSFMLRNSIKTLIIDSMCAAITRRDPHVAMLQFSVDRLHRAYNRKLKELKRPDLKMSTFIAKGTYGEVFSANSKKRHSELAIKLFKVDSDALINNAAMFLKYANHPNIVSCQFLIEREGRVGYAMELAGLDLYDYMLATAKSGARYKSFSYQIVQGISYISSLGYVHNDLKPDNILVYFNGESRVVKIADPDMMQRIGGVRKYNLSTPTYASPEDNVPGSVCETSSDIFSFGGVLYYMLTKEEPWQAIGEISEVREKVCANENPSLCKNIKLSEYRSLISWCWKYEPSERPTPEKLIATINKLP